MSQAVANQQHELAGKYRPYPEYKNSGVEWLGEIPAHWDLSRIKYIAQLNPSKSEVRGLSDDTVVSFIPMEAIGERGELDVSRTRLLGDVLTGYSYITNGDVMLAKITPCFENGKGAVVSGLENGIGFATTEVIPARPYRASDAQFLYYLFTSDPFKSLAEGSMYGAGGQKRVADSFVAEYHFAEAPAGERDSIAAFLDYETARIDRLIAKQQQLIELLKEKRQAVISHAVTKGLNPDAPMKDSGVEWLGQVPGHWVVSALKFTYKNLDYKRIPLSGEDRSSRQGDYPYYGASGIIDSIDGFLFSNDHVLVGEDGANLVMRSTPIAFVATGQYWVNNHAHILGMNDGLNSYWAEVIENLDISPFVSGSAQPKLTAEALGNLIVAYPDTLHERREIQTYINREKPRFAALIERSEHQVQLLQERRTALISAAVTGKIDLRDWAPPVEEVAA